MKQAVEHSLGFGSASRNTINVAPIFFSTTNDAAAMQPGNLGYANSNAWSAGDDSTDAASQDQPVSSFTVLDTLLLHYADEKRYPSMKTIHFVGHGAGAQMLSRWAVVGASNPAPDRLSVRYIIGESSSFCITSPESRLTSDLTECQAIQAPSCTSLKIAPSR